MEKKSVLKRTVSILLCVILIVSLTVTIYTCEKQKIKELNEFHLSEIQRLIEASFEVNDIFYGNGLPVYSRDECLGDPVHSFEKDAEYIAYFRETIGKEFPEQLYTDVGDMFRLYYYLYRDTDLSRSLGEDIYICRYDVMYYVPEGVDEEGNPDYDQIRESFYTLRRDSADVPVPEGMRNGGVVYKDEDGNVTSTLSVSEEPIYTTDKKVVYYALEGYEEPLFEYEYGSEDNENYDVVRLDGKYLTIDSIKGLSEQVYSNAYLSAVYSSMFDGIRTDFSDSTATVLLPRYIEEASGDDGLVYLRKLNIDSKEKPFVQRTYDYSTIKIRRPYNKDRINIVITAYGDYFSSETNQMENGAHEVSLSFVLENGAWKLDSPTY